MLARLYREHAYLLEGAAVGPYEREDFVAISTGPRGLRTELEALLNGGSVEKPIDEHVALRDIETNPDAVWSFLLSSGYLRARELFTDARDRQRGRLDLPNREVRAALQRMVEDWMSAQVGGSAELEALLQAVTEANETPTQALASALQQIRARDYATELPERGASPVVELAAVFDGKRAWVARGQD